MKIFNKSTEILGKSGIFLLNGKSERELGNSLNDLNDLKEQPYNEGAT
jgi:hypothetical protein